MKKLKTKKLKQSGKLKSKFVLAALLFAFFASVGFGIISKSSNNPNLGGASASSAEPADYNNDNVIDILDLAYLLSNWGNNGTAGDLNNDNKINIIDLSLLLNRWGPVNIVSQAGAQLPIQYDLGAITATKKFIAPNGSDSTGNGTEANPYKTLKKAIDNSGTNGYVIVRGGKYSISEQRAADTTYNRVTINKAVTIKAYPNETPIFDGSKEAPTSSTTEGSLKWISYTSMSPSTGLGMNLLNLPNAVDGNGNLTNQANSVGWKCINSGGTAVEATTTCANNLKKIVSGYYPDQVWVGGQPLTQVTDKAKVTDATKFFVDNSSTPAKLYLHSTVNLVNTRVSQSGGEGANGLFMLIYTAGNNVAIEGLKIMNHSPSWSAYTIQLDGDNTTLKNMVFDSNSNVSLGINAGPGNILKNLRLESVTINHAGWMGLNGPYSDDTLILNSKFTKINPNAEFVQSPASGAIKMTKAHRTKIIGSEFSNIVGHGVWFDQSCYDVLVADSKFENYSGSGLFYEISHKLTLLNNYFNSNWPNHNQTTLRLAASSALRISNNTVLTSSGPAMDIHTDGRSKTYTYSGQTRYCSEHHLRYGSDLPSPYNFASACPSSLSSDLDRARLGQYGPTNMTPGMTWIPSADYIINNAILKIAGTETAIKARTNDAANIPMNTIIKSTTKFGRNILQVSSGTVGNLGGVSMSTATNLNNGLKASPYSLSDQNNVLNNLSSSSGYLQADGKVITSAAINHNDAVPVPSEFFSNVPSGVSLKISSGQKYYGSTFK